MNKSSSSSSSSTRRLTPPLSSSTQEQKAEPSQNNKPDQRERQATVIAKRGQYSSQRPTRFTKADDRDKNEIDASWAPASPSTQAKSRAATNRNPVILRSPRSSDFVELDTDSNASENSPAEVPTKAAREKTNEDSPLLAKEDSSSITIFGKTKLQKLPGAPRFGGLNKWIISPRNKTKSENNRPTISRENKTKQMQAEEQFSSDEENPFSPYEIAKAKAKSLHSKDDVTATIKLPEVNAENFTPEKLASILARLFSEKGKDIDLRIMNILYCATGGASALEKSDSYPEIGACAAFLSNGQNDPLYTTNYMNTLFRALTPRLDKKLRKELENAYLEHQEGRLALQKCLETHLDVKPSFEKAPIELEEDLISTSITMKPPGAPDKGIQVTMDNVVQVIGDTANVPGVTPNKRAFNLIYCAAEGRDVINRLDCPETGAFAQSLRSLPDDEKLPHAKALIKKFARHILPLQMSRLDGEELDLKTIQRVCRHALSEN